MEAEIEIWKDIVGYEGKYQISSHGRVKGLPRKVCNHTGFIHLKERFLKGSFNTNGYIQVQLSSRPNRVLKLIHVLVATAFIPNPNKYPQINHINGDKSDNRIENLEWCNNSMNQIHAYKMGLNTNRENSGKAKRSIILISVAAKTELKFESIISASKFLGGKKSDRNNLLKVLSNKYPHNKTIKGYLAKYL